MSKTTILDAYVKKRMDDFLKIRDLMEETENDEKFKELKDKYDDFLKEMDDIDALSLAQRDKLESELSKFMFADDDENEEVVKKFLQTNPPPGLSPEPGPVIPTEHTDAVDKTRQMLAKRGIGSRKQKKSRTRRQKKTQRKGRKQSKTKRQLKK
jgi:hypothetical protein